MDRLYYLEVLTPAGTLQSAPQNTPWPLEDNQLVYVDILVPPGNSSTAGFRVLWATQQVIPWGNDSFLVTDNEKVHVDCDFDMTITGLVIQTYNTDIWDHTIYLRALIRTITVAQQQLVNAATGGVALPATVDVTDQYQGTDTSLGDTTDTTSDDESFLDSTDTSSEDDTTSTDTGTDTGTETTPPLVTTTPVAAPPPPVLAPQPKPVAKKPAPIRKPVKAKTHVKAK